MTWRQAGALCAGAITIGVFGALAPTMAAGVAVLLLIALVLCARFDPWGGALVVFLVLQAVASAMELAPLGPIAVYARFVALGVLVVVTLHARWQRRIDRQVLHLTASVTLFAVWALMSALWSIDAVLSVRHAVALIALAAVAFAASRSRWRDPDVLQGDVLVVWACLSAIVILSLAATQVGFVQTYGGPPTRPRFQGLMANPNTLAMVCLLFLPLTIGLWRFRMLNRAVLATAGAAAAAALYMTDSRAGIAATLIGITVAFSQGRMRRPDLRGRALLRPGTLLAAAAIISAVSWMPLLDVNLGGVMERFEDMETVGGRLQAWEHAIHLSTFAPVGGHGFRTGELLFRQARSVGAIVFDPDTVHNGFIQTLLELGWVGVALLGWVMVASLRPRPGHPIRAPLLGAVAAGWTVQVAESSVVGIGAFFASVFWLMLFMVVASSGEAVRW